MSRSRFVLGDKRGRNKTVDSLGTQWPFAVMFGNTRTTLCCQCRRDMEDFNKERWGLDAETRGLWTGPLDDPYERDANIWRSIGCVFITSASAAAGLKGESSYRNSLSHTHSAYTAGC